MLTLETGLPMHQAPNLLASPSRTRRSQILFRALPLLLSLATAGLLWASFFPLNQGWCAWFALVPLLLLVRIEAATWKVLLSSLIGGFVCYFVALKWMRVAHPMMLYAWLALSAYIAAYFPATIWLLRRLDRAFRLPLTVTVPIVWVSLEYLRSYLITGFQWYFLGHTQHDYLPMIQIADLGGVYGVTLVVAAANGLLAEFLGGMAHGRWSLRDSALTTGRSLQIQAAVLVLVLGGTLTYGFWRLSQTEFVEGPRVALLQTNVEQGIRNARRGASDEGVVAVNAIVHHTKELTDRIKSERQNPDLIIWPETTFTEDWLEATPETPAADLPPRFAEFQQMARNVVTDRARYSGAPVLLGLNTEEFSAGGKIDRYNSALLVDKDGPVARYDKIHCVAFGEYVPMKETLPFMKVFWPYDHDFSLTPGHRVTRFRLATPRGEFRFGVLICYEDSVACLARPYARQEGDERAVDFLVNISNDGWFDGTEEHEEHLVLSRFRAVESRRAVARAVNMGISAIIDGNGRIRSLPRESWSSSKKVPAAFTATVPIDGRTSVYALWGDWLAVACCGIGAIALAGTFVRRRTA